jgi:hypothetical protein
MNELGDLLTQQQFTEASLVQILLNLLVCMVFVSLVGWFYKKYSRLEALSFPLPLVCSDIPNHRACLDDEKVSFFELDNLTSLCKAVGKVKNNLDYYKACSHSLWVEKFSSEAMGVKHIKFFNSVIASNK